MAILGLLAVPFVLAGWVLYGICAGGDWLVKYLLERRRQRQARIEAELDRKQTELRRTILTLASELNGNALEARKALIRESFLARGEIPSE